MLDEARLLDEAIGEISEPDQLKVGAKRFSKLEDEAASRGAKIN